MLRPQSKQRGGFGRSERSRASLARARDSSAIVYLTKRPSCGLSRSLAQDTRMRAWHCSSTASSSHNKPGGGGLLFALVVSGRPRWPLLVDWRATGCCSARASPRLGLFGPAENNLFVCPARTRELLSSRRLAFSRGLCDGIRGRRCANLPGRQLKKPREAI